MPRRFSWVHPLTVVFGCQHVGIWQCRVQLSSSTTTLSIVTQERCEIIDQPPVRCCGALVGESTVPWRVKKYFMQWVRQGTLANQVTNARDEEYFGKLTRCETYDSVPTDVWHPSGQMQWLVQLYQVMSPNCVDDALSLVRTSLNVEAQHWQCLSGRRRTTSMFGGTGVEFWTGQEHI